MSYMICCVPTCIVRYGQGVALHTFPNPTKEIERFRSWIFNIGGEILGLDNTYIFKNRRVCHNHFEEIFCYSKNKLSKLAVPSLFGNNCLTIPSSSNEAPDKRCIERPTEVTFQSIEDITVVAASTSTAVSTATDFDNQLKTDFEASPITRTIRSGRDTTVVAASTSTAVSTAADFDNQLKTDFEASPITRTIRSGRGLHQKMTNEESHLKDTIKKLKVKLAKAEKSRISFKQRLALVRQQCHTDVFNVLSKKMTESAKIFFKMQLLQSTKKHKGRRYTLKEKILALSIYKPSPKAYRFLSGICALPSPKTLQKLLHKLSISAGFNEILFNKLKQRVAKMPNSHRFCSLIFDEMAISTGLSYDKSDDKILGFVENGTERKCLFADHVLVFMVRGVIKKFKQPILYTFCSATTNTTELKNLIKEVIIKIQQCGLEIVATICDQGATNKAAINSLINDSRAECLRNNKEHRNHCFEINKKTIISIYDPPHLLKGIRNNLLTKDLHFEINGQKLIAKWSHILNFYKRSPLVEGVQLVPKLTAHHVIPNLIPKMNVKHCTQVFSSSVGIAMLFMTDSGKLPMEYKDTARLLIFFDKLFDSLNGSFSHVLRGKIYRAAVTPTSPHHKLWTESLKILKSMKFLNNDKAVVVPSLSNWIHTIEGIQQIVKYFKEKGITSLLLRNFNQDPLENFFGAIRAHGQANTMPNAAAFQSSYKTLLINNMSSPHSIGANCEKDDSKSMQLLRRFFKNVEMFKKDQAEISILEKHLDIAPINTIDLISSEEVSKVERCAAIGYCSGWIVKNIIKLITGDFPRQ